MRQKTPITALLRVICNCLMILMILMILGPLSLGFQSTTVLASPAIIDRVVLTINNIPYTQTQIERYITVKESLRDQPETAQIVQASTWEVALDGFIADMTIHQEASKSSGFRPSRETVDKLRVRSDKNLEIAPNLKAAFNRLGLSKANTETEILRIATVENYRRGRASMNGRSKDATGQWEKELKERTIVRFFDDAKVWKSLDTKI